MPWNATFSYFCRSCRNKRFVLLVMCFLFLAPSADHTQAKSIYRYAYLALSNGALIANLVDPSAENDVTEREPLDIPTGFGALPAYKWPRVVRGSPQGNWAAFIFENRETNLLRLVNLNSHEARNVLEGSIAYSVQWPMYNMLWSPNGQYLAFQDIQGQTAWIYSLADNQKYALFSQNSAAPLGVYTFGWSPDSQHLAIGSTRCEQSYESCSSRITTYSIVTRRKEKYLELAGVTQNSLLACRLTWSPDNRYLAFYGGCEFDVSLVLQEVFLWDTQDNRVGQITNFVTDFIGQPNLSNFDFSLGYYDVLWGDNETLLIGTTFVVHRESESGNEPMTHSQTLAYHMQDDTMSVLSSEWAAESWQKSPNGENIAYLQWSGVDPFGIEPRLENVEIAQYENRTLTNRFGGLSGCNLAWSPSSDLVAFTQADGGCTWGSVRSLVFVNITTGNAQQYTIKGVDDPHYVMPIGWVAEEVSPLPPR